MRIDYDVFIVKLWDKARPRQTRVLVICFEPQCRVASKNSQKFNLPGLSYEGRADFNQSWTLTVCQGQFLNE